MDAEINYSQAVAKIKETLIQKGLNFIDSHQLNFEGINIALHSGYGGWSRNYARVNITLIGKDINRFIRQFHPMSDDYSKLILKIKEVSKQSKANQQAEDERDKHQSQNTERLANELSEFHPENNYSYIKLKVGSAYLIISGSKPNIYNVELSLRTDIYDIPKDKLTKIVTALEELNQLIGDDEK